MMGYLIFAQSFPLVKIIGFFKNNCHEISPPARREKISDLNTPWKITPQERMDDWIQSVIHAITQSVLWTQTLGVSLVTQ